MKALHYPLHPATRINDNGTPKVKLNYRLDRLRRLRVLLKRLLEEADTDLSRHKIVTDEDDDDNDDDHLKLTKLYITPHKFLSNDFS